MRWPSNSSVAVAGYPKFQTANSGPSLAIHVLCCPWTLEFVLGNDAVFCIVESRADVIQLLEALLVRASAALARCLPSAGFGRRRHLVTQDQPLIEEQVELEDGVIAGDAAACACWPVDL